MTTLSNHILIKTKFFTPYAETAYSINILNKIILPVN